MSHMGYWLEHKCQSESTFNKIVVRRLPPNFTLAVFRDQVSPLSLYNYIYFVPGNTKCCGYSFSRAYINFVRHEDVYPFKEKYDNYAFIGLNGMEYYAVVEFAPYQETPIHHLFEKNDNKSGTIHNTFYFKQFLNNLNSSGNENHENTEYDFQLKVQNNNANAPTPLLKYLSRKKSEQGRVVRKKETKQTRNENCLVFFNSSVKKCGNHRSNFKRHSLN